MARKTNAAEINKLVTGFRAANALEGWAHIAAVHSLLVHLGGPCPDGCDQHADPVALSVYETVNGPEHIIETGGE